MQKIISVFQRNYDTDRLIRDEVVPGAEWVLAGEGIATRKYDGACCMIQDGELFRRYDAKKGKQPPICFIPAQDPDPITGHWPGWVQVGGDSQDKWFREAWSNFREDPPQYRVGTYLLDGTYEAVGPHFQGNPEHWVFDTLIRHGITVLGDCPRDFEGIREYVRKVDMEGIVFHHTDGRMAKVKKKDYGMKRVP